MNHGGGDDGAPGAGAFGSKQAATSWIQDVIPYGIFTTDRDLRIKSWNEWLVSHSGLRPQDVIGRLLQEVFPELEPRRLMSRYARALEGEVSILSAALHKHLLPFPVTVSGSDLPNMLQTARIAPFPEGGRISGSITIIEDVTQREYQAGILHRQQAMDRLLSDSLATLIQANDPSQEMKKIFSAVSVALGLDCYACYYLAGDRQTLSLQSSLGLSPRQKEVVSVLQLTEADRQLLLDSSDPSFLEIDGHSKALRTLGVRSLCTFPLAVGERIIGMLAFGSHMRDAIAAADSGVVARIAKYVAIALDRARRERETVAASRAKDDFLAALSHELRTPLNPVLLVASDAATNTEFSDEAREVFHMIEKNALLEARLIDDLLDLTRIANGKLALDMQLIDLLAVVRDAIETVRPDITERKQSITLEIDVGNSRVLGDVDRLRQVFWNIVKNAVKFTPVGGQITVTSSTDAARNEIRVTFLDSGIGMDPAEIERVFGAFAQGDHAEGGRSHRFGGLGLGLAISRRLVEMHSGRIEAFSEGKGRGSSFTVHLPLAVVDNSSDGAGVADAERVSPFDSHSPFAPVRRILLVEDHESTRQTLARLLERRGFEVVATDSMSSALEAAAKGRFNLVLSDIGLPDGDGFALMRQLVELHHLRGIALTGYGMEADVLRSNEAGFIAHITKPISARTLDRALEQAFAVS